MKIKLLLLSIFLLFSFFLFGREKKKDFYKKTITVSNEMEFINALGDNTRILIQTKELNLSNYIIGRFLPDNSNKIKIDTDKGLTLNNFTNLEITAETKVNIVVDWKEQTVLSITNSRNIILNNLRMYHKVPATETCEGGVLDIEEVKGILIQNCELNGSGIYGVYFTNVLDAVIQQSQIYNNSRHAIGADSSEILIQDSWIFKNPSYILFWFAENSKVHLNTCYIEDNIIKESIINPIKAINLTKEGENVTEVTFENCIFTNNSRGNTETIPPHIFNTNILVLKSSTFKPIYPIYRFQFYDFVDENNIIYRSEETKNLYNLEIEEYNKKYTK